MTKEYSEPPTQGDDQTQNASPATRYCIRPLGRTMPLARMTMQDIERVAFGAEEIGEHEDNGRGQCAHCGQSVGRGGDKV